MNSELKLKEKLSTILVLAGGKWQVPLIQFLKSKGHPVFVVDPYVNSPGVVFSSHHIQENILAYEAIFKLVRQQEFQFILTDQSDIAVLTVAHLNKYFNLPGPSPKVVSRFSNKLEMRNFARSAGFPSPRFAEVKFLGDIKKFIDEVGLPVMLKPVDSQSSRGIYKIDEDLIGEIDSIYQGALNESYSKTLIIEEFLVGSEITVEGFASRYKHRSLALSKKKHFRTGVASELRYPAQIDEGLYQKIIELNDAYVEITGLQFGITHAEYIVNEETWSVNLVEIACRGGGSLISSHIAPWVSGIQIYENYYQSLLNPDDPLLLPIPLKRPALLKFFEFPVGKVKRIHGIDTIIKIDEVLKCELEFSVGDLLSPATDDRKRQGFVIILAQSQDRLCEVEALVDSLLVIEYE